MKERLALGAGWAARANRPAFLQFSFVWPLISFRRV